jgi:hypothetical protein
MPSAGLYPLSVTRAEPSDPILPSPRFVRSLSASR